MAYADYTFYTTEYGGKLISETDFPGLANRAAVYINTVTMGAAKRVTGDKRYHVQMANCAIAEVMQDEERLNMATYSTEGAVTSETVGSWSRSYGSKSASGETVSYLLQRKQDALRLYLGPLGLLKIRPVYPCGRCCL